MRKHCHFAFNQPFYLSLKNDPLMYTQNRTYRKALTINVNPPNPLRQGGVSRTPVILIMKNRITDLFNIKYPIIQAGMV